MNLVTLVITFRTRLLFVLCSSCFRLVNRGYVQSHLRTKASYSTYLVILKYRLHSYRTSYRKIA
jgi:hypothetical protein